MKNIFKLLCTFAAIMCLSHCSDDDLTEPTAPADDPLTSAASYKDLFLTLEVTPNADTRIEFRLSSNGDGKVSVNWGDGSLKKNVALLDGYYTRFYHTYSRQEKFTINVTGDLNMIDSFLLMDEQIAINDIHFGGLPNLMGLDMYNLPNGPQVVNFSKNRKLAYIALNNIQRMQDVILPTTNVYRQVNIAGSNDLTTAVVDRIIARVHDSVLRNPRVGGDLELGKAYSFPEDAVAPMVGPPSSYSINKLRKLRDVYQWRISPGFE
jgi:hypothetical protein